jgi:hypothetical protein
MPAPPHPHPCTHRESHGANAETPAQILPDAGRKPDFNAWLETLRMSLECSPAELSCEAGAFCTHVARAARFLPFRAARAKARG